MHERFGPSSGVRPGQLELHELFPATSDEVVVVVARQEHESPALKPLA